MRDVTVTPHLTIPAGELAIAFARSGGPGGQNVNKVSSKVELRWNLRDSAAPSATDRELLLEKLASKLTTEGELIVTSTKTRDQIKNREDAFDKLTRNKGNVIRQAEMLRQLGVKPTKSLPGLLVDNADFESNGGDGDD